MGWLQDQFLNATKAGFSQAKDAVLGFAKTLFRELLSPIVGVPHPKSNDRYVVVGTPDNEPWATIYQDFYLQYVLPLTILLLIISLAYIGLRAGSISPYRQKKLLRRIGIVFLGSLIWFPVISVPLQFVNAIGIELAPIDKMASNLGNLGKAGLGGIIGGLIMVLTQNLWLLIAGFVFGIRWVGIIVLSVLMPLLGVLWAMEVWPLNSLANMAKKASAIYPGLIIAGIPAAVLFQVGWTIQDAGGATGIFGLFVGIALIPGAIIASLLTIYWSSGTVQKLAKAGATGAASAGPKAAKSAKKGAGKATRGAQNVHRGYSDKAPGAVTKDGQTTLGSGGSKAYKAGSAAKSAKGHAGRYNNLRKSRSGRMRDKAKEDLSRVSTGAKGAPKHALRKTKNKVSRW